MKNLSNRNNLKMKTHSLSFKIFLFLSIFLIIFGLFALWLVQKQVNNIVQVQTVHIFESDFKNFSTYLTNHKEFLQHRVDEIAVNEELKSAIQFEDKDSIKKWIKIYKNRFSNLNVHILNKDGQFIEDAEESYSASFFEQGFGLFKHDKKYYIYSKWMIEDEEGTAFAYAVVAFNLSDSKSFFKKLKKQLGKDSIIFFNSDYIGTSFTDSGPAQKYFKDYLNSANKNALFETRDDKYLGLSLEIETISGFNGYKVILLKDLAFVKKEMRHFFYWALLIFSLFYIFIFLAMFASLRYFVFVPLDNIMQITRTVTNNDFSKAHINFNSNDEMGVLAQSFNYMFGHIGDITTNLSNKLKEQKILETDKNLILSKVTSFTSFLTSGSKRLKTVNHNLQTQAQTQEASLNEINKVMLEIETHASSNAKSASDVDKLIDASDKTVQEGAGQMNETMQSITMISESNDKVSKILKNINEISFQTNLLALNAAVEAARAGKHGKGFAVVAEEVRGLAAKSSKYAEETEEIITESKAKISIGVEQATKMESILSSIIENIQNVAVSTSEISQKSINQSSGITQTIKKISELNKQNKASLKGISESYKITDDFNKQVSQLNMILTNKTNVNKS